MLPADPDGGSADSDVNDARDDGSVTARLGGWPDSFPACSDRASPPCPTAGEDAEHVGARPDYLEGDGTVYDRVTGLEWQKKLVSSTLKGQDWLGAKTLCQELGPGWRLPTLFELSSIIDYGRGVPRVDMRSFDYEGAPLMRTSTAHHDGEHWMINVDDGTVGWGADADIFGWTARCVQGAVTGSITPVPDLPGLVRDTRTGLEW